MKDKFQNAFAWVKANKGRTILSLVLIAALITTIAVTTHRVNQTGDTVSVVTDADEVITVDGDSVTEDDAADTDGAEDSQEDVLQNQKSGQIKDSESSAKKDKTKASEETEKNADGKSEDKSDSDSDSSSSGTASQYKTCTVCITCAPFLDDASDTVKALLPANGVILSNTTVEYKQGESVYDVLLRVCQSKNIPITATSSVYGAYVSSIDNLAEKNYDMSTGWCYVVNGTYPSVSCSSYTLNQGDVIVWQYDTWSF